jgi:hypothetical protein
VGQSTNGQWSNEQRENGYWEHGSWDNAKWDHTWFKSGCALCQCIITTTIIVIVVSIVIVIITIACIHHPSSIIHPHHRPSPLIKQNANAHMKTHLSAVGFEPTRSCLQ